MNNIIIKPILVEKYENIRHGDKIIWYNDDTPHILTFVDDDYDKCYFYDINNKNVVEILKKSDDWNECIYYLSNHKEYIHDYLNYINFFMLKSYKYHKCKLEYLIKEIERYGFSIDKIDEYLK